MTFSQFAGIAVVPTLARLVLAGAFITAGWGKFSDAEFNADQATRLRELDVTVTPAVTASTPSVTPATYLQTGTATQPVATKPQTPAPPTTQTAVQPPATQPAVIGNVLPPGKYLAKSLHFVTLMVDSQQWPYPTWMAYGAALTELVGGVLILLGLFSRLWGLALSCVMGVAFYLTSLPALAANGYFGLAKMPLEWSTMYIQLSLFVLAFGVLLTGAGPLSLDRLLFGGRREEELPPTREPIRLPG